MSIISVLMLASAMFASHNYASSSVLANGTFVRIRVAETGLHAISFDALRNMGLNPASVRVYGYGGAMLSQNFMLSKPDDLPLVPVFLDKGADGVFNSGDRLIFFAQGPVSWSYNGSRFVHKRNTYSDFGYYFLTSDNGATEEIRSEAAASHAASAVVNTYTDYRLHERDSVNLIDRSGIEGGGREFYGEQFAPDATRHFSFRFENLVCNDNSFKWFIDLAASSTQSSTFSISMEQEKASVGIRGISTSNFYLKADTAASAKSFKPSAESNKDIAITFRSNSATALGFLNYIEINATCSLALPAGNPLLFRSPVGYNTDEYVRYEMSGATAETQIWDVTDPTAIRRVASTYNAAGKTMQFTALNTSVHEYVAFNPSASFPSPASMGQVPNQNLHQLTDIDMVIISPEDFLPEAERLAEAHRTYDNMTVAVVTDKQVYNEFSSGTPDATAYRWLMKMLYDRAIASNGAVHKPGYLCLFGDGTFDNRKLLGVSGNNWLLTYQAANSFEETRAYTTDDYFGFLDDNEGEVDTKGRMDIAVGRLPVNSLQQAAGVVNKLIRHISGADKGKWKSQLIFLADDGDSNLHTTGADLAGESVRTKNPDFVVNKIYLDAYTQEVNATGESYPLAQTRLNNLLNTGALLFNYTGHSGYNNASSEGLVTLAGIRDMQNAHPAFWIFASCSFALFDAGKVSAAEEAVLNPDGGAIGICAASRTVFANPNATLNKHICDSLFHHTTPFGYHNRIGDAVRLGKNACGADANKMAYVLLGDPAISLHFPTEYQVVTSGISDTLNALDVATVEGYIQSEDGDTASWFNGRLNVSIYDKMQKITTLDNDETDEDEKVRYTYNDYPNILFQGETTVRDGKFSYTFMVPKDIRYNFGNGRIVYYALDSISGEEGVGHYENFVIGGSSDIMVTDTLGPELNVYLGSSQFANGGQVNEAPHFFAHISDEHGINTVGSGIGHDLLLIIDNKASETYVLNDYFSAANNSYTQGNISYRMAELSEGKHTLFFRAWDLLNNSSSRTVDFEVVKGLAPSLISVISYPNPVEQGGAVSFAFEYDQPDIMMNTDIFIYDISGRLVHSISQRGTEPVQWNLAETCTPPGVYMYKVQLSSATTKTISKTGKLIITK